MEENAPPGPSSEQPRASTTQVAAVSGSVGLLVGFAAGLLVASTRSDAPPDAAQFHAPAPAPSVSTAPEALAASSAPGAASAPAPSAVPAAAQTEAAFHLDLHRDDARSSLTSGFYGVEGLDTEVPAVWSQGLTSTVSVPLSPAAGDYVLVITARTLASLSPLSIAVRLNGAELGKVSIKAKPGDGEVAVPNGTLKAGSNELVLTYPRTAKPATTVHGSTDVRDLAINLFKLDLRPK